MKAIYSVGLLLAGGIAGAVIPAGIRTYFHTPVVHAQDQLTYAGCVSEVPKSWGNFVGGSTYGLAFQDDKGTLRFLQHPICGIAIPQSNLPTAAVELQLLRK